MAKSQLDPELIRAIIAAQAAPQTEFDPTAISQGAIRGMDLAATIEARKNSQEDRVKALREKIEAVKREKQYKKAASAANPDIANEIGYIPKESAESILKGRLASESDEAKLNRARLRQEQESTQPDRVKQLFQVGDKVMGVTYGGNVKPIDVPGGQTLSPLQKTLPAEQVEKGAGFESMSDLISRIKADIVSPQTGELSEEGRGLLGPLDVTTKKAASYTPKADPLATQFYQKVQDLKNQIIYLRSGKQINEEEYKRLRASLPSEYRDESVFLSDLANFERTFKDVAAKRQAAFQQAGYNVPGNAPQPAPTGNPGQIDINALGAALGLPRKGAK